MKVNRYIKKTGKVLLWIIGSVIGLFLLVVLLIQVPVIQNKIKDKAVTYLEGKIHTKVVIGKIEIGLPKKVILEDFYFEDQQKDTLLAGEKLSVDISLFKLLSNEVEINSVSLKGITANVSRNKDSVFNFDYIIKAFASKEKKEEPSEPMKISINKINLDRVRVKFDDKITKNDLKAYIAHFETEIDNFDLDKLAFDIPKIKLDGLDLKFKQGKLVEEIVVNTREIADSLAQQPNLKLKLGTIDLTKIKIGYDNEGTEMTTGVAFQKMLIRVNNFDIQKQIIDLESLDINTLKGALTVGRFEKAFAKNVANAKEQPEVAPGMPWKFRLNQADMKKIAFRYNDQNSAAVTKGIDYKHLDVKNFNLVGEKFVFADEVISGNIYAFTVQEKSGLDIQSLKTEFYYGKKNAHLKKLYLKTPQTLLKDQIIVGYPSIASLGENIGDLDVNANLSGSHVGFKDILIFVPDLADTNPFQSNPNAIMQINSRIIGKVNNLQIPKLEISGIGSTIIAASGTIKGLPDAKKAYFNLKINQLSTTSKDIAMFVPKGTIPNTIQLPTQLAVNGNFSGYINNFATKLNLVSSYGNAKIDAKFDQRRKNAEKYNADVSVMNFNLGKLIKNDSIGRVTLRAKVNGSGLDPKTANAKVIGKIYKADFNGYVYRDLALKGNIKSGEFVAEAKMTDPNLSFDLASNGDFGGKYPAVKLKLNLDIADLEKLNLHAGPMKLRGQVDADIPTADPDYLNGNISIHDLMIANKDGEFALDSINVTATATAEKNTIALRSQFIDANMNGKYQLTQVGTALSNSIAKYYDTNPNSKKQKTDPQQFAFDVKVKNNPLLLKLVPEIKSLDSIAIAGRYNSQNDSIVVVGLIPKLVYGENTISNAVVNVNTVDNALVYSVVVDDVQNPNIKLPYTSITGTVKENLLSYILQLKDVKDAERYLIAGTLKSTDGNTEINLIPEGLKLNYENWTIAPQNVMRFGEGGIYADDFELSNAGTSIKIQSESETPNAPIAVDFKDFKIETLTSIVQKDSLLMGGRINGNALLKNLQKTPVFTADLTIDDFNFKTDTIGKIGIKVHNEVANTYDAKVEITGNGNQVNLDGIYRADNSSFNMNLDLQHLNIKSIQGFTAGNLRNSTGFLTGRLNATGTVKNPKILGEIKFNDGAFTVVPINSNFKLMNDKIVFDDRGIYFEKFSLSDENDNQLFVLGRINTPNYQDFAFNLNVKAANFRAMNSKEKDNDLYYGEVYLDTDLKINGDLNKPVINGRLKLNKDTKLTIVLPQSDPSIVDREGVVEFIDQDKPELKTIAINDSISKTVFRGINASVNIEIDKKAELNLIIDKGNGDYLSLKGEARLTGGMDESGKTTLTGRYEFSEGTYQMTFNLLKRKFDIKDGSYIVWTGEPTKADINITAVYKSNTAPIDLVDDQLGGISESDRNQFKQRIPFETNLIMKGELLKPDITFDIVLPKGNNSVSTTVINTTEAKLAQLRQQPSELNKQVFAVLLLNRFIGENPFASEAGGATAESLARQSASKILSQQLNNLAGDLIKGVELEFDLDSQEDYTSGQRENRTDLNVGLSKTLLDDRLKVTVGSSFGLEGTQQANRESNNIAGDLSADYQLSKDGRYRVRVYRKNQYQVALQGQVIETGVGFIITIDYNKFREIFRKVQEEEKKVQIEKEENQE